MTNNDFQVYLRKRLDQVRKDIDASADTSFKARMAYVEKDLVSMIRISALGGTRARRVRRDYIRRLARQGIDLNARLMSGTAL